MDYLLKFMNPNVIRILVSYSIPAKNNIMIYKRILTLFISQLFVLTSYAQQPAFGGKSEMQIAIESKNIDAVKVLINSGVDINEHCTTFDTPIDLSIKLNDIAMVKFLLSEGATDKSSMFQAAKNDNLEMIQLLLQHDFEFGNSLIYAAENDNMEIVQFLVEAGSEVNLSQKRKSGLFSRYYVSPIDRSIKNGNLEMVKYLISKGVSIENAIEECFEFQQNEILKALIPEYENKDELLSKAFIRSNTEIIRYLINAGADINYKDDHGNTLLHITSKEGNILNTKMLIEEFNASINAKNESGETPLMLSASSSDILVTEYLLTKEVEIDATNNHGETALFYSLENKSLNNFNLLLNKGADPDIRSNNNTTLLIAAAKKNQVKAINYLLDHGVNIDAENDLKEKAFDYIITDFNRNFELVNRFLDAGADINQRGNRYNKSLMFFAIEQENIERIKELHERGASVDPRDSKGNRADVDNSEIIMYLIENGADINALDDRHDSFLCVAVNENDLELAHYLVSKNIDVDQNCYFSEPPLVKAIESNNVTLVKFLVDNDADINAIGYFERNVMEYAKRKGNQEIIDYLKGKGAMSKKDKNELYRKSMEVERKIKTAMALENNEELVANLKLCNGLIIQDKLIKRVAEYAAESGNPIIFEILISNLKFNIDSEINLIGQTPLIVATENNKTSLVDYLYHRGALLDIMDDKGKTAEDYIRSKTMKKLFKDFKK